MSVLRTAVDYTKRRVLPPGLSFRRVLFGPAAGCWIMLDLHQQLRLYLGLYEREIGRFYRELLAPGMKAYDIGGRDGYSALLIARRTGAEVLSFECEDVGIAQMRATFERNALPIRAVQAFVGAPGDARTTLTIDTAAERYFAPDFIKIDVEGGEGDVLRGAGNVLRTRRPALIVEVHGTGPEEDCLRQLRAHGYAPEVIDRSTLFPERRPLAHNRWLVCRRPGGG